MIIITVVRTSKGVEVNADFKIRGKANECVEEFAAVISALRKADEDMYLLAALADTERAKEELEHGDKE